MSVPARRALCLVAALACAAAVSATITPAAHAIELGWSVEGAWYVQDGLIKVLAQEAVDPSSVDPDRISLRISDGGQSTQVPLDGVVAVRDDTEERVILVYLPPDTWEEVSSSKQAFLTLEYGAFMHIPDGSAVLKSTVRVAMPDQHITMLLVRLEYNHHTDRFYLNFVDAVNVSRADWDGVYLREFRGSASGPVFRPFLGLDPMVAEGDGGTFVFALDARGREILLGTGRLILYTGNDTVASWDHIAAPEKSVWVRAVRLASAEYAADENRLYLRFTDGVNPYSIHLYRMYFFDLVRFEEMRGFGFVGVSDDRRTIILDLSESARYDMSVHTRPWMVIKAGAVSAADGTDFGHHLVRLKVTGAADFFPPDPDIPAGLLVGRVDYDGTAGEVTVRFREAIDPSSINASRIILVYDRCAGTTLSGQEMVQVAEDGKSAVVQIGSILKKAPTLIRLTQGSFATEANGTENAAGDVLVPEQHRLGAIPADGEDMSQTFTGERTLRALDITQEMMPCRLTYSVDPISSILNVSKYGQAYINRNDEIVASAVRDGLAAWSELNPFIIFEEAADENADITVEWMWLRWLKLGDARYSSDVGGTIRSVIRVPDQVGNWNVVGYDLLRNTVTHEFGHILGLGHHTNPDHLMWGDDDFVQDPFDTLGYNIPPRWEYPPTGIFRCTSGCLP